jgi:Carboxypeptidase regulatory-like domain/TonB dependent receptor-like, beta-barrel
MQRIRRVLYVFSLILGCTSLAWAAETGSISGIILDQAGNPVEGVTVTVVGDTIPAGRTVTTTASGIYSFPLLQPGHFIVTAEKVGIGKSSRPVIVEVDRDSQVDLMLGVKLEENVTVTASTPDVDLKSTEVNFNYTAAQIATLPLKRTYAGLFQLIPGVADNNSFAPNAGASRQDNVFLLDGVNITNPGFGYLATEVNEFDIAEFNIKRGGITAEFGRAQGFVANAVTRSGTNTLHGGARQEAIPADFIAASKGTIKEKLQEYNTALALGGPIVRDKLFFYGSAQFLDATLKERVNRLGTVPDRANNTQEYFGKVNALFSARHQIDGGIRVRPREILNASIGATDAPSTGTNEEGTNRIATANYSWFVGSRTYIDVKFLRLDEQTESHAINDLGFQPTFNVNNLAAMGYFSDNGVNTGANNVSLNRANYYRNEVKAKVSHLLDFKGTSHQIKAGFGWEDSQEDLTRVANGWGTVAYTTNRTRVTTTYYPRQPSQLGLSRSYNLFAQDDITFTPRLTVNAGLLFSRDEFAQKIDSRNTFLTFGFGDEIQPRVGVNYNLRDGKGDKIYANYGRYYALDQKSSSRSLAPNRLFTSDAVWDAATGQLLSDTPAANVTGKVIVPGIKAPYSNEYLAGYATPLMNAWSLDVFFIYRDANQFIEDAPTVLPFSSFVYDNYPAAERKYRALTFEVNRRLANRWSLNASYALSKLYGNFDLDYGGEATLFNTSSLLGDGPGSFLEDTFRQGPLSQDRTHVVKLFATVVPIERLTLGGYLRTQSGAAWEARGLPWGSTLTYLRYLEPAGSRRTDAWTNADFLVGYKLALGGPFAVTLEGRVLNLFNSQPGITVDKRQFLDGRIRSFTSTPDANCGRACYTDLMVQGTTQPNPDFGTPLTYAPARRLYLTAKLEF